ncbi:tetratricopeptide repeat protein [Acinetobacter sp. c1-l78]|uniref:tetratricopeptide repeat protein n=1 Tax=Acinetobacter sp. c1-l78 TaxID=3342803 RepID=UPI0035BA9F58
MKLTKFIPWQLSFGRIATVPLYSSIFLSLGSMAYSSQISANMIEFAKIDTNFAQNVPSKVLRYKDRFLHQRHFSLKLAQKLLKQPTFKAKQKNTTTQRQGNLNRHGTLVKHHLRQSPSQKALILAQLNNQKTTDNLAAQSLSQQSQTMIFDPNLLTEQFTIHLLSEDNAPNQTRVLDTSGALLPTFAAEFALAQGNIPEALRTYQSVVEQYNLPDLNERALKTALEYSDIDSALNISKRWVEGYPDDVPAMFYLAHLSLKAGEYKTAIKTLEQILTLDENADLEGILAGIYPDSDEERKALFDALKQINKKDNPSVLVMLAGLEAQNGEYDSALRKVDSALRQRPHVSSFVILKANLYFASNRPDLALAWLDKSTPYQKTPDVGLYEVQYLVKNNQHKTALAKLQKMLKSWPENERLLFLAGVTSIDLKQAKSAENYLSKLTTSGRYQDDANYYLGINAERLKEYDKAIEYYLAADGNLYTASRKNLAKLYLAQDRSGEMIRLLTQERVSHPHQASFLYQLQVQLLKQNGQGDIANQLLDEAIQQMPENTELIYEQVLLLDPLHDKEKLKQRLDTLLVIEPDNPVFLNAYAYTLARQNRQWADAKRYAEQALSIAPDQASILDTLGYIAFLQNDYAAAVDYLAQAFQNSHSVSIGVRYAHALYMHGEHDKFDKVLDELIQNYPLDKDVQQLQLLSRNPKHHDLLQNFNGSIDQHSE